MEMNKKKMTKGRPFRPLIVEYGDIRYQASSNEVSRTRLTEECISWEVELSETMRDYEGRQDPMGEYLTLNFVDNTSRVYCNSLVDMF